MRQPRGPQLTTRRPHTNDYGAQNQQLGGPGHLTDNQGAPRAPN